MSTALLFAALIATFLTVAIAGLLAGLAAMGVSAIAAGLVVTKNADHVSIIERVWERIMWAKTKATKRNVYRSGPLAATGWGRTQAPGVAAPLRLSEHVDSLGRPFALIYSPPGGLHTLVIETEPDGAALVDDEQIDQWVGSWGWWLSHLAGEPGLVGASVTVETAPDTGGRLGREVAANISATHPSSPARSSRTRSRTTPRDRLWSAPTSHSPLCRVRRRQIGWDASWPLVSPN
nr:SCO6880 family protein [Demequina litorisediminis]